jgi:2-polyprenyl-3-methyl-5-hydroxy-6-metoxy-1,4-benzoquinol methylase
MRTQERISTRRIRWLAKHFPAVMSEKVLDIGCGDFLHLRNFAAGSVGLDGRDLEAPPGYHFIRWNFEDDIADTLSAHRLPAEFQAVLCNDVLEHVLGPHQFLINVRRVLKDDGILFLGVPLVNPLAFPALQTRSNIFNYFCGFLAQDHVNFFTFSTLRHTVEFAGFRCAGWYSPFLDLRRPMITGLEPVTVLALQKMANWNYGPKAYKSLDSTGRLQWKPYVNP